jgi:hypothetical protein
MSQNAMILRHLKRGEWISPLQALRRYGCFRLGARIYDLKKRGIPIVKAVETDGRKRWARYRLSK